VTALDAAPDVDAVSTLEGGVATWLCAPAAAFITGAALPVDGGWPVCSIWLAPTIATPFQLTGLCK
jgi:NAD(P)-dependent dehydrogenase (short-subunit alcohol dehydrogenase family)